jgi:hypothetical protein
MEVVMKQWTSACAVFLLAAGCAAQLPQTPPAGVPPEVSASEVQPGNAWRYAVHDGYTKLPRGTVEYRVRAVQGNTVTVAVLNGGTESVELYARDGNWLQRPATNMQTFTYSPPYPAFAFPLAPGKTWRSRVTATDPADGRSFPVMIEGSVLGWERVRVPAGEFDALKVRRNVFLDYFQQGVRGQSVIVEHEWYAPALKQAAKREAASEYLSYYLAGSNAPGLIPVRRGGRGGARMGRDGRDDGSTPRFIKDDWLVYELVSYSVR